MFERMLRGKKTHLYRDSGQHSGIFNTANCRLYFSTTQPEILKRKPSQTRWIDWFSTSKDIWEKTESAWKAFSCSKGLAPDSNRRL